MKKDTVFLSNYTSGEDAYEEICSVVSRYGSRAVLIGGKKALAAAEAKIKAALKNSRIQITGTLWYGGNATYEHVEALLAAPEVKAADVIFAIGGGRAIDTCKVVADKAKKVIVTFPTIASNCAACTAISVMYQKDGSLAGYYYPKECPQHVFIDTQIIAESPEELFWAGIGDALSKECEVELASRNKKLSHTPLMGRQLCFSCTEPLLQYGKEALLQCKEKKAKEAMEQVVLDIIISTGIVSNLTNGADKYYYNSSLAHCFYNGFTLLEAAGKHLHGEVVAFGVLVLLTYDHQEERRKEIAEFNVSVNLPVTLKQIGVKEEELDTIIDKAACVQEWKCTPYPVDKESYRKAILEADAYGRKLLEAKQDGKNRQHL